MTSFDELALVCWVPGPQRDQLTRTLTNQFHQVLCIVEVIEARLAWMMSLWLMWHQPAGQEARTELLDVLGQGLALATATITQLLLSSAQEVSRLDRPLAGRQGMLRCVASGFVWLRMA
jgi:hypothetical protein